MTRQAFLCSTNPVAARLLFGDVAKAIERFLEYPWQRPNRHSKFVWSPWSTIESR